jgi:hypothetical protein
MQVSEHYARWANNALDMYAAGDDEGGKAASRKAKYWWARMQKIEGKKREREA